MTKTLPINERFLSLQGEGKDTGLPTFFIRIAGCNLSCKWCDTKYSQKTSQGKEMSFEEILSEVPKEYPLHVCVTGGEPLSHENIVPFLELLGRHIKGWVTVETNGSIPLPYVRPRVSWAMDFKCPSSGMDGYNVYENAEKLHAGDQLKFVIANREDYDFAKKLLTSFGWRSYQTVFQLAYESLDPTELAKWILEDKLDVRLGLQQQKIIWGGKSRGV